MSDIGQMITMGIARIVIPIILIVAVVGAGIFFALGYFFGAA